MEKFNLFGSFPLLEMVFQSFTIVLKNFELEISE
jgi:hypothetical protein